MQLLQLYYKIAMMAATSGNSLDRWCKVTTCMIEKVKGISRIDKLRVIHIYEADYNLLLKIMWSRKGVWNSHNQDALHEGQAGSRPGKRAIEVVVNKEMKYLYSRLTRTNLGTIDNDAKSCFDRIVCNVAMPISGYYGIPLCYRKMQATTLKKTTFTLSTAMGESEDSYQHSDDTPIHGTGQGSCSSPAIWLFISSFLMSILEKQSTGMEIQDILKDKETICQWIEGFVDDTSIFANTAFNNNDIKQLKERLTRVGTWWAGLLEATGGRLELTKCFYYLLTWKFDKKGSPQPETMSEQIDNTTKIQLQHRSESNTPLQQKDITSSHKTLGSFKTMSGDEGDHYTYLLTKSNDCAEKALHGQLNRRQAKLAYSYNYIPSLSYSLTAMCLTESQLEKIQKKAVTQFIRLMGYEACFPRGVVYGPKRLGGLEIQQLYVTSFRNKIECILGNINCNNTLGKIMQINLNFLQLHSGKSIQVMTDTSPLSYIQTNWFMGVKTFLNQIKGKITINDIWTPSILRQRDMILMDAVDCRDISKNNKTIFNNWRLYFNVTTLAEITNAAGDSVMSTVLHKSEVIHYKRRSMLRWPIQEQPHLSTFHIWKQILHESCGIQHNGKIRKRLGKWKKNPHKIIAFRHVLDIPNQTLYSTDENAVWRLHNYIETIHGRMYFSTNSCICQHNVDLNLTTPVDIISGPTMIQINTRTSKYGYNIREMIDKIPDVPTINDFTSYVKHNHATQPGSVHFVEVHEELIQTTTDTDIEFCSDGGLRKGIGGFGVVASINKSIILQAIQRVNPTYNQLSSYRTEALGILSVLYTYMRLVEYRKSLGITHQFTTITIYCDNESVIKTIHIMKSQKLIQKTMNKADTDVFMDIIACTKQINTALIFKHIRGHQDKADQPITFEAYLNCLADTLATTSLEKRSTPLLETSQYVATLSINNLPVFSNHHTIIKETFHTIKYRQYLKDAFGWHEETLDTIWWDPLDKVLNNLPSGNKTTLHKFMHKRLPCNKREHLFYPYLTDQCKLCADQTECTHHVLQCKNCEQQNKIRNKFLSSLTNYLQTSQTSTTTTTILTHYIKAWLHKESIPVLHTIATNIPQSLQAAIYEQSRIGWDQIFSGRLSSKWGEVYTQDLKDTNHGMIKPDPIRWGRNIISLAYDFV